MGRFFKRRHYLDCLMGPMDERKLDRLIDALKTLDQRIRFMFEDLQVKVAALKSASDSAELLLDGIKKQLDDLIANGTMTAADKQRLQEISDAIDTEAADLAAAVVRNTPAAPTP